MFLIRQPRQEPGGEQALRHRLGRRRRADRPGPRMRTPPPVAAPPPHDPGDLHLPVDLLAVLGAQELKRLPAFGAAPLAGIHIDEPFLGLQLRMIPPPVTRPARPLSPLPLATGPNPAGAAVVVPAPAVPPSGRTALLARGAEQQPAQRRHALLQPVHLPGQLGHLRGQPGPLRPQRRGHRLQLPGTRLGPLRAGTPVTGINIPIDHRRGHTTQPTPPHNSRHAPNPRRVAGSPKIPPRQRTRTCTSPATAPATASMVHRKADPATHQLAGGEPHSQRTGRATASHGFPDYLLVINCVVPRGRSRDTRNRDRCVSVVHHGSSSWWPARLTRRYVRSASPSIPPSGRKVRARAPHRAVAYTR